MIRFLTVFCMALLLAACGGGSVEDEDSGIGDGNSDSVDGDPGTTDDAGADPGPGDGDPGATDNCTFQTCQSLGKDCGQWPDGCTGSLDCGGCPAGEECDDQGQCQASCTGHCTNNSQDCGETGVDCGGECVPCELCVYADNPRYFTYLGKPVFLMSSGLEKVPNATDMNTLNAGGVNQFRTFIAADTDHVHPYNYSNPGPDGVDNNWGGWNEGFWSGLQAEAQRTKDRGSILLPVAFSTPMLECQSGDPECDDYRWAFHLWNVRNGGPIDAGTSAGKPYFYTLHDFDNVIFGNETYSAAWPWQKKSQYRQEQLMAELMARLPEDLYSNVGIVLMWEIVDGWGNGYTEQWAVHMIDYLKSMRSTCRPLGIGSFNGAHAVAAGAEFGLQEGHHVIHDNYNPPVNLPIIYEGFNPRDDCYDAGEPHPGCQCFDGDPEPLYCNAYADDASCNAAISKLVMREAVLRGMNSSYPFRSYWWQRSGSIYNQCFPAAWDYVIDDVRQDLLDYGARVRAVLDSVTTWADEPGHELIPSALPAN